MDQYRLLDFGNGRKLEQFGALTVDRPSPAADRWRPRSRSWTADLTFERTEGSQGKWRGKPPDTWTISHDSVQLRLQCTPFGHLGLFPEQAANWDWIAAQVRRVARPLQVLNLFGYTGGSTLAAAAAGAAVTHVDSAKNTVGWARENAQRSQLADAPIRWVHEDARKFAERELKRGRHYDAVVLDPPTYGHGPDGQPWNIDRDLRGLLQTCAQLTEGQRAFMLLTCHSPGFGPAELEALLADSVFGTCQANAQAEPMRLQDTKRRALPAGVAARWPTA